MVEMELKYRVLNALSQTDGYVSGGEMAARFNVSRTLVWKAVNQLRRDGHAISTVNKLGYRLEIQNDIINPHVIGDYLEKSFATQKQKPTFRIESLDEIDSTNEYLKRLANAGAGEITVAVADRQTQGDFFAGFRFTEKFACVNCHFPVFKADFRRILPGLRKELEPAEIFISWRSQRETILKQAIAAPVGNRTEKNGARQKE